MNQELNKRLLSLDILRGITIAGMILVNNPGSWSYVYAPLEHAEWIGLTPTDLVFPFFMFIMGISTYISLQKYGFEVNRKSLVKLTKRSLVIFLIGLFINWLSLSFRTYHSLAGQDLSQIGQLVQSVTNFDHLRTLGVMQRLALSYFFASLVALFVNHRHIPLLIFGLLLGYFILLFFGNGFEFSEQNIIAIIDKNILGTNHLYMDGTIRLDPEGLVSTIPAICHVLVGFYCGKLLIARKNDKKEQMQIMFIAGAILTFVGFLLSYGCPISKKIWSPTFVLVTCGLASTLLGLLIWIVDLKGYRKWSVFFESFGVNPLFTYVAAGIISILLNGIYVALPDAEKMTGVKNFLYTVFLQPFMGNYLGSLAFAILFVGSNWAIGNILYKKQIYIKI
jgi:predicted acyltransferase